MPIKAITAAIIFFCLSLPATADDWDLVYKNELLSVSTRLYQQSPLKEIKGTTKVKASLSSLVALFQDAEFNDEWVYRSGGAKIVKKTSDYSAYVYGVVDAPWPMRDRDTIVRFDLKQNRSNKEILISISNFPHYLPKNSFLVRVPDFGGYWLLKPITKGWVEVTYQVHGHPGGLIPIWLANKAAIRTVIKTLENIQSAADRYTHIKLEFIAED